MHFVRDCDIAVKRVLCVRIAGECFDVQGTFRLFVLVIKRVLDRVLCIVIQYFELTYHAPVPQCMQDVVKALLRLLQGGGYNIDCRT